MPVVIFVLPALLGYPVMPGDDLTQNFPLRVLAGAQLRQGHLPLFDPYIWSGAPLLGGWNAGAVYPLTFLFALLPGAAAWTIGMTATWWVAGLGTFAFLRASRLAPVPGLLGALSFAFAGAMTAQLSHFGLVAGMSWVPVTLLACLRLSQRPGAAARLAWLSVLAAATAMVVLAGEPRAIDNAVIILASYTAWRAWRLRRSPQAPAYLGLVLAGVALGVAVSAVQWLPGLYAVATSQRAAHSAVLFGSGSLPLKWLLLLAVPDLMGGSGSFGQPAFFASYNLTEVTGYAGLMPLVAAFALLGQVWRERRDRRLPEWLIWHIVALTGLLLALGERTALGHLLFRLPFFGDQRLQSRNLMVADFALAVLLAYWADRWLGGEQARGRAGGPARRLLGALPGGVAIAAAALTLGWADGMQRWLGLDAARASHGGPLRPWLLPSLALGVLAIALVWWGPRLAPGRRMRALVWFVSADLMLFTLLSVVTVAPGLGHAQRPAAAAPGGAPSPLVPVGELTHRGRFAIYDPGLVHREELPALGMPDSNLLSQTPSIEGYSAIVDGTYAAVTGAHRATGDGQDVLGPRAIGDGTLDQLGTTVLLAPSAYLLTPASAGAGPGLPGPGFRAVLPHQAATWYFGAVLPVTSVTTSAAAAAPPAGRTSGDAGHGLRVGVVRPSGTTDWLAATSGPGDHVTASVARPRQAVAIRVIGGPHAAHFAPPVIATAGGRRYRASGELQAALVPPRWRYSGFDGAFGVFRDSLASPPLTLQPVRNETVSGASIRALAGPRFAPASASVSSPHGVTVIRAVAGIPGWTAAWRPAGRQATVSLPVHRRGLVQAVTVPAGRGILTWRYDPPGTRIGLPVSLAGLAVLIGLAITAASLRRRRARGEPGQPAGAPDRQQVTISADR